MISDLIEEPVHYERPIALETKDGLIKCRFAIYERKQEDIFREGYLGPNYKVIKRETGLRGRVRSETVMVRVPLFQQWLTDKSYMGFTCQLCSDTGIRDYKEERHWCSCERGKLAHDHFKKDYDKTIIEAEKSLG